MPGIYLRSSGFQKAWTLSAIPSIYSVVVSHRLCSTAAAVLGGQVSAARGLHTPLLEPFQGLYCLPHRLSLSMAPSAWGFCFSWGCPILIGLPDLSVLSLSCLLSMVPFKCLSKWHHLEDSSVVPNSTASVRYNFSFLWNTSLCVDPEDTLLRRWYLIDAGFFLTITAFSAGLTGMDCCHRHLQITQILNTKYHTNSPAVWNLQISIICPALIIVLSYHSSLLKLWRHMAFPAPGFFHNPSPKQHGQVC